MAETTPPLAQSQSFESSEPPQLSALPQLNEQWQSTLGWQPTAAQQALFQQLYETIVITNQSFNLTRITAPHDFWEKHLWDSLRGIQTWLSEADPQSLDLVDIGTGAGFPGLPIAIAKPDWKLTLVDSTRKKVKFVQQTATMLGLTGVDALSDRAEQLGHSKYYRAQYDLATIRAVANPAVCIEYVMPLLRVGGTAILYRGQWTDEDAAMCERAVTALGGKVDRIETFETPLTNGARSCAYLKKLTPTTNEYPRAVGLPTQNPL